MKKILFLITKATAGGAQKYVYDLVTNLPRNEFEPLVAYGKSGTLASDLAAAHIPCRPIPAMDRDIMLVSDIRSFFQILKLLRTERPDIVHLNSSKAAALGALAARFAGVRSIIFTVHGWPFLEPRNFLVRTVILVVSWLTGLLSTHVIVVSRADKDRADDLPFLSRKTVHIPIGLSAPDTRSRDEARSFLLQNTGNQNVKIILTIAELTRNKGIAYGIEAVAELRRRGRTDFRYVVIGSGEMHRELIASAQSFKLDNVTLLGFVPEAAEYVRGCDAFLLPSLKEGLPYALLEAATAGVPIVASDVGGVRDILANYPHGVLVPPRNPTRIADAILELEKRNVSAGAFSLRDFGLDAMLEKTLRVYRS